ncbi:hypothetical protein EYF80_003297 [Liparis tanakae]|uniref:Uncharacterized protein n=1 Tax=Liparis tanakae TaxID=230148 RepID=A0A4Z2J922_9TELE|nr:hypothetical protein EYF80_003297 [Liparis tanakae]
MPITTLEARLVARDVERGLCGCVRGSRSAGEEKDLQRDLPDPEIGKNGAGVGWGRRMPRPFRPGLHSQGTPFNRNSSRRRCKPRLGSKKKKSSAPVFGGSDPSSASMLVACLLLRAGGSTDPSGVCLPCGPRPHRGAPAPGRRRGALKPELRGCVVLPAGGTALAPSGALSQRAAGVTAGPSSFITPLRLCTTPTRSTLFIEPKVFGSSKTLSGTKYQSITRVEREQDRPFSPLSMLSFTGAPEPGLWPVDECYILAVSTGVSWGLACGGSAVSGPVCQLLVPLPPAPRRAGPQSAAQTHAEPRPTPISGSQNERISPQKRRIHNHANEKYFKEVINCTDKRSSGFETSLMGTGARVFVVPLEQQNITESPFGCGAGTRDEEQEEEEEEEEERGRSCHGTYVSVWDEETSQPRAGSRRKRLLLMPGVEPRGDKSVGRSLEEICGSGSGVPPGPVLSSHLLEATALSGNYYLGDKYGDKAARAYGDPRGLYQPSFFEVSLLLSGLPLEQRPQAPHHLLLSGVTGERRGKRRERGGVQEEERRGEDVLQREANGGDGERQAR